MMNDNLREPLVLEIEITPFYAMVIHLNPNHEWHNKVKRRVINDGVMRVIHYVRMSFFIELPDYPSLN